MSGKWTPGPWYPEINGEQYRVEGAGNPSGTVAVIAARPSITAQADARLIAEAPVLYELLDEAINYLAVAAVHNPDANALLNKSTAALAKARGQS